MSRHTLNLSTLPWRFGLVARQQFDPTPRDDRDAVREWLPARVPGDIRADLIAAGRIPPVETPAGIAAGAWVDDYDGWYVAELAAGDDADAQTILEADGIDYYSAIWLDDQLLATHAGMSSRQVIPLAPWINAAGPHPLAIRVWGGGALPRLPNPPWRRAARWLIGRFSPGTEYFPDRMAIPKAQFSFGWDFAPRLLSAGIWDEIRLVSTRGAYIENLWTRVEPLTEGADPTPVTWRLRLRVTRWQPGPVQVEIILQPENFSSSGYGSLRRTVTLCDDEAPACTADYDFNLEMAAARRWWPWDQGEPCLYRVTVRLLTWLPQELSRPYGEVRALDEISQVVGVRSVAKMARPGGAAWRWVINERNVFLRGANCTPVDTLPGRATAAEASARGRDQLFARLGRRRARKAGFLG